MDSIATASAGLQAASRLFDRYAEPLIVPQRSGPVDTVGAVVGLLDARNGFAMDAAVLRVAADMQKRVLDILV